MEFTWGVDSIDIDATEEPAGDYGAAEIAAAHGRHQEMAEGRYEGPDGGNGMGGGEDGDY